MKQAASPARPRCLQSSPQAWAPASCSGHCLLGLGNWKGFCEVVSAVLPRHPPDPSPSPFLVPRSPLSFFPRVEGHGTQAQHSLPNCCTAIPMEAIQETLAACSSNAATNSTKKTPKERSTPNTSADWMNADSTTIHPQPPSGGSALRAMREGTKPLQPPRARA